MRGEAKERGVNKSKKESWNENDLKVTWAEIIPPEMWEELAMKLNLGSNYDKGAPTANKHVTYHAYINKTAEEIRLNSQRRYRTDTEVFRVAIHLGMNLLYNIFIRKSDILEKSRTRFFYEALADVERDMERATMLDVINTKRADLAKKVNKKKMTHDEAKASLDRLFKTIPEEDRDYISQNIPQNEVENIKNIESDLMKNFLKLRND